MPGWLKIVLIVVACLVGGLAIIAVVVGLTVQSQLAEAQGDTAKLQLEEISRMVEIHRIKTDDLPADLNELIKSGITKEVPADPWDNQFVYRKKADTFELSSMGPDGKPGTQDDLHRVE